jgi:hypothetical protein
MYCETLSQVYSKDVASGFLSCPGFVMPRVCRVQGLSCSGFVVFRVCRVQGLSVHGLWAYQKNSIASIKL